jgi:hypothetical protein
MKIYFKKKSAYKKTNHQSIVSNNAPSQCLKICCLGPSPVKKLQVKKKKNSGLN